MYYLAAAGLVASADGAAPNVVYSASGTFAAPAVGGADIFMLSGHAFSVRIEANEALQPTKHTQTSALYTNLVLEGEVYSLFFRRLSTYLREGRACFSRPAGRAAPIFLRYIFRSR